MTDESNPGAIRPTRFAAIAQLLGAATAPYELVEQIRS